MKCRKCGNEISTGILFCPYCGERISAGDLGNETPLYQTEVKGLLKSGTLVVYQDRTEFVMSRVQKMTFEYTNLVSVKKGLDRINFFMSDGKVESCTVNRKNIHEAFFVIEQASRPYIARRNQLLLSEGVRYSFPSSRPGLNSGILNIMDDRVEYRLPSGTTGTIHYSEVKSSNMSAKGVLELFLYDGTKKAFTVDKELREPVSSFVASAIAPYMEERRKRLLSEGIYFSFLSNKGTLNILEDRMEYKAESGQNETIVFKEIRRVHASGGKLEIFLTNGTAGSFTVDKDIQDEVFTFIETAIAPFVAQRTAGFETTFGIDEKIEINEERGVFHILRQDGREISREYPMGDVFRGELMEIKAREGMLSGTSLKNAAAGLKGAAGSGETNASEKIKHIDIVLTLRSDQGVREETVRFGDFSFGINKANSKYDKYTEEAAKFFSYMEAAHPDCELIRPEPEAKTAEIETAKNQEDFQNPSDGKSLETGVVSERSLEKISLEHWWMEYRILWRNAVRL